MAQRKQLTWTELRVGVFVLIALAILAIGIFYITGAGSFGPKYRLLTYLPEVEQVTVGAPVSLDGVEIGNFESIRINPKPQGELDNIQLVPLSPPEQQRVRDRLTPVTELLRKYRLR